jgi:hypothetical protein
MGDIDLLIIGWGMGNKNNKNLFDLNWKNWSSDTRE